MDKALRESEGCAVSVAVLASSSHAVVCPDRRAGQIQAKGPSDGPNSSCFFLFGQRPLSLGETGGQQRLETAKHCLLTASQRAKG